MYSYAEQLGAMLPSFILAVFMAIIIKILPISNFYRIVQLIIQVIVGVIVYVGCSALLKLECFNFVKNTVIDILFKKT